jgi:alpha-beta hydrolase superfamily lysophospholipase
LEFEFAQTREKREWVENRILRMFDIPYNMVLQDETEAVQINPLVQQMRTNPVSSPIHDYFVNSKGLKLFYRSFQPKSQEIQRVIIGCHGMAGDGEYFVLFADQIVEQTGTAFYIMDYRGHGRSEGKKGDITDFQLYIDDLKEFVEFIQKKYSNKPFFIMGESMGGIVSINYIAQNPEIMRGVIEFAPAVRVAMGAFSILDVFSAAYYLLVYVVSPGKCVVATKGREDVGVKNEIHQKYDNTNPYHLDAVSPRYLLQLNKFSKKAYKLGNKITCPILIFQGEEDKAVSVDGVKKFFETIQSKNKELVLIPEAFHAMFTDPSAIGIWDKLRAWLNSH